MMCAFEVGAYAFDAARDVDAFGGWYNDQSSEYPHEHIFHPLFGRPNAA